MKAHVYKVELLVIDHESMGEQAVRETLENQNRYVSPHVMALEGHPVDWDDAHPLNNATTQEAAFRAMFAPAAPAPTQAFPVLPDASQAEAFTHGMAAAPAPQQEPLTLLQIQRIACDLFSSCGHDDLRMARAVEAAHGIGAQQDGKENE